MAGSELHLMMVAGEASGDLYGACLAEAVKNLYPEIQITGIGGSRMRQAGVELFALSEEMAVVGLVEVLSHWRPIRRAYLRAIRELESRRPHLLILIDYPDFNLRLARVARRVGTPILYFISPQVWAWRPSRVRQIAARIDRMLVILPFEEEIYRRAGVPVRYVGHPLLELLPAPTDPRKGKKALGLDPERPVLGLLPGSRRREVGFHFPVMLEAAILLRRRHPDLQLVVPVATTLQESDLQTYLKPREAELPPVRLIDSPPGIALTTMDAAVVKSGTATLEAALMGIPMVVVYRTTLLTYLLASLLASVRTIGLVNIVAEKALVPELIQGDCTPPRVASALEPLLQGSPGAIEMRESLMGLRLRLGSPGCFRRVAEEAARFLEPPRASASSEVLG